MTKTKAITKNYFEVHNKIKTKFSDDTDDEEEFQFRNQLGFFKKTQQQTKLIIPIDQVIVEPSYYRAVVQAIMDTTEGDEIEFNINSPGGSIAGLQSLLSAIWSTEANTVARISGDCSSAASILAMNCESVFVSPCATMLAHGPSYSTGYSKNADIKNLVKHVDGFTEKLFRESYELFLTEEEIEKCLNGYQLYLDAEEIMQRLAKKYEILNQRILEQEQQEEVEVQQEVQEVKPKRKQKAKVQTEQDKQDQ
jgi:ATP-dependent protease ClpP protease subunit